MKFQIKIIIAFSVILAVILFYINSLTINFLEIIKEDYILKKLHDTVLNRQFVETYYKEYIRDVLLWEALLVLSLMLILYKVIDRLTKKEKQYNEFIELLFLMISHKFGNFLSIHKGNIEILKIRHDQKAVERLEKSYNYMVEDFKKVLQTVRNFKEMGIEKEKINLKELILKHINALSPDQKIILNIKDIFVYANRQITDNIIYAAIENAVRYSEEKIHIRLTKKYLTIRNDISSPEKGTGIGLKIVEALAKKEGFKLLYRQKGDFYLVQIKLK